MNLKRKSSLSYIFAYLILIGMGASCSQPKTFTDLEIVTTWTDMTLYITQFTPANSPTYASRCTGYIGLTMYESIVPGYPSHQSVANQLNGLGELPKPETGLSYDWPVSLNAAHATILKSLYNQTSDKNKGKIDSLEKLIHTYLASKQADPEIVSRSVAFGKSIAEKIFFWSKTDGGHRAYLRNFDKSFVHPLHPGSWKPPLYAQSISHNPLHPFWGSNRTFLQVNAELAIPEMIPYDTTKGSPYYQEFVAVYEKELSLTQEQKEAALWWGDDPDDTFTPPGHSFFIANLVIKKKQPDLIECAETYAQVGMAVADAFINCWKWKYHYFSERPNTFIPEFIDPEWESFWPDPPFPSFPSGHAIQAAASMRILETLNGEFFAFIDSSHISRERDEVREVDFVERHFTSFWEVALETANSRFFGGIHTPQDNTIGLVEGSRIARNVNELDWRK